MLSSHPLAAILRRPLLRVLSFFLLLGLFFLVFFPPTHPPRHLPHFQGQGRPQPKRPHTPALPHFESHLHSVKVHRPVQWLEYHRGKDVWAQRADAVRDTFLRAYNSYVAYAAPHDELLPVSKSPTDKCVLLCIATRAPLTRRPGCRAPCRAASTAGVSRM